MHMKFGTLTQKHMMNNNMINSESETKNIRFWKQFYMDPPFFTQRKHSLSTRDESKKYEFDDSWDSLNGYLSMIKSTLSVLAFPFLVIPLLDFQNNTTHLIICNSF